MSGRALPHGARLRSFGAVGLRSLRARPLRSLLTTAGIVLGVGMAFGVLILVATIHSTFNNLYDAVYGNTSLIVSGKSGVGSVPAGTLPKVRRVEGVKGASGTVYGVYRLIEDGRVNTSRTSTLFVAGVDFDAPNTAGATTVEGHDPRRGDEIEIEKTWAEQHGYALGDTVRLATPSGAAAMRVGGIYEFASSIDLGGYGTAAMPVTTARRLTGKRGSWDEVSVIVEDGASVDAVQRRIEALTGPGVEVRTPAGLGEEADESLAGLDIVLYFFSGMALFVGAFLILNSFNMTVLQRIREIGTLRALGASRRRIAVSIVREALILGAIGCVFGLGLGVGLAYLLAEVMRSLFGLPVSSLDVTTGSAIAAILVGLLATIAGALYPGLRAGRVPPIRALTGSGGAAQRAGLRRALVGLALFLPGLAIGGLFWFSNQGENALAAIVGVGSTVVMFVGMVLLAPFVVMPVIRVLTWPVRALMPAEGRLASDSLRANALRTSATAAALVVTLSVVIVDSMMSASFVGSISDEINARFARDLTIQPLDYSEYGAPSSGLAPSLRRRIAALPASATVTPRRVVFTRDLPGGGEPGLLVAVDPTAWPRVDHSEYVGSGTAQAMAGLSRGGVVLGKGYSENIGVGVGERILLKGPSGSRRAPVVGLLETFEASGDEVVVSLATMKEIYGITTDSQLAVTARSAADRRPLAASINRLLAHDYPGVEAVSNQKLKEGYEEQINQQFAFFNAIIGIAVIVGLLGIINALSMSVIERTREIGVLRALGGSRWRVRRTMLDESLLISLAGCLAGIAAGLLVGFVWIVSVRESTLTALDIIVPIGTLVLIAALGIVMGTLAAIVPARSAARLNPLQALTYE
ncbi:MAG TPA: FtsX-like permease family protein [Solirubrobacterales bacterium]